MRAEGERDGETPALDPEDVAVLLRIWQVLRGPLTDVAGQPIRYAHVFVDEVQDGSPIELRVLMSLATSDQSITLAGDIAQRMFADGDDRGEFDWGEMLALLGVEGDGAGTRSMRFAGQLPLDRPRSRASHAPSWGPWPIRPSPSPHATGRRWSCSSSRRLARQWPGSGTR